MGTLLADGVGDTVRVSLTEDPVNEVPAGRELVRLFAVDPAQVAPGPAVEIVERRNPLDFVRRTCSRVTVGPFAWGGEEVPRVELVVEPGDARLASALLAARPPVELVDVVAGPGPAGLEPALGFLAQFPREALARGVTFADAPAALAALADRGSRTRLAGLVDRIAVPVAPQSDDLARLTTEAADLPLLALLRVDGDLAGDNERRIAEFARASAGLGPGVLAGLALDGCTDPVRAQRLLAAALDRAGARVPLVLGDRAIDGEDPRLGRAGRLASLLLDGIGDAVRVAAGADPARGARLQHDVLQAARRRLERADYIACPSCGRTLFDLENTTERVRELTSHLKLKIAVMGCVVNGPGEMADADYGYVGWGAGKVALFVGRDMVERDIPFAEAPQKLVDLIKRRGHWTDPADSSAP
ncbi:MAG: flavodoxin-dependent (E)-4-hydroxy-3-methylbut-2-enyl-diphosphate synthase [Acidobacteria bacterium]|nr:flavodoxin-dependent (E)-4-hydroxy-3-methylbut-2-enyl-diphosphate synthase [Acidobacteriota bacterium]